jgi:hypothetical protein
VFRCGRSSDGLDANMITVARRRGPGGDLGPVKIADRPLLWQEKAAQEEQHLEQPQNGTNGFNGTTNGMSKSNGENGVH